MKRCIYWFFAFCLCLSGQLVFASQFKVVFINPGHASGDETGQFWANVNKIMSYAAEDLDIELVTLFANRNHVQMKALAHKAAELKPDYVVVVNEKGVGLDLLNVLAKKQLPVFALLNKFSDQEIHAMSANEQQALIGSVVPDNVKAGKQLLSDLLALHGNSQEVINVLALGGDYTSAAAIERKKGFDQVLSQHKSVKLVDYPIGNWSSSQAYNIVKGILKRQRIDVVWAANDPMAIGAKRAIAEANLNYKVSVGGINWDVRDAQYSIDISYGGHVILGAKALAMLFDYHQKRMLPCEMNVVVDIFRSSKAANQQKFLDNLNSNKLTQFDFKRLLKQPNNALLDLDSFIDMAYKSSKLAKLYNSCINTLSN